MTGSPHEVEKSTIMYDSSEAHLTVESGGNTVEMNFVHAPARFLRQADDGTIQHALWVAPDETEVLDKMLGYILDKVKISEPSRLALEAIRPRVQQLKLEE